MNTKDTAFHLICSGRLENRRPDVTLAPQASRHDDTRVRVDGTVVLVVIHADGLALSDNLAVEVNEVIISELIERCQKKFSKSSPVQSPTLGI